MRRRLMQCRQFFCLEQKFGLQPILVQIDFLVFGRGALTRAGMGVLTVMIVVRRMQGEGVCQLMQFRAVNVRVVRMLGCVPVVRVNRLRVVMDQGGKEKAEDPYEHEGKKNAGSAF